jgi:molybdopterin-guanine dinucleotide biosynthesis protein A
MNTKTSLWGLLVAGGRSQRMGQDKALIEVDGLPLWRRQLELLSTACSQVAVAAPVRPQWLTSEVHLVPDAEGAHGPLAGLIAGLRWAEAGGAPGLLALAVDLPRLEAALLQELVTELVNGCGIVCRTQWGFEPLCALYPTEAVTCAVDLAKTGDWKMQNLVARLVDEGMLKVRHLSESETLLLLNINTPSDWAR